MKQSNFNHDNTEKNNLLSSLPSPSTESLRASKLTLKKLKDEIKKNKSICKDVLRCCVGY